MYETKGEWDDKYFPENNRRVRRQKQSPIRVVIGNPPYSAKQEGANDNNQNLEYETLDARIAATYADRTSAVNKNNLYDSYIRAIRWASDRINGKGIVGFVTNSSFIDGNAMDGLRTCLAEEFSTIYVFNLRGNQRTSGETSRMEGGKIFGSGSRAGIAISLFIKNPDKGGKCELQYHEMDSYLPREEKLAIIRGLQSLNGLHREKKWKRIQPNDSHDWINQRDPAFDKFRAFDEEPNSVFLARSRGVETSRDPWVYNTSRKILVANMTATTSFYNTQVGLHGAACRAAGKDAEKEALRLIDTDLKKIKWTRGLIKNLCREEKAVFSKERVGVAVYRPFCKAWLYYDRHFNEYFKERIYPSTSHSNLVISVPGSSNSKDFSCLVLNILPDLNVNDGGGQCFPLYLYEKDAPQEGELISHAAEGELVDGYRRRSAITDAILADFRAAYEKRITKEDIFYYVYGVLHSPEYRTRFASDLKKMLPRLPFTRETADFWRFSQAGRDLAQWHLNYETVEPSPVKEHHSELLSDPAKDFLVQKMTFGRKDKQVDKTTIHYNARITLTGIPLEAYDYVVNGKPALEWIMERYQITVDKDSGIRNDPNDWAREHKQPRYILDLLKRIVRVSLETMKIVNALPALNERK
ncbi:MAG: type ISP restriction/modification enzyme, partial [Verrucomicrobiota bacterium]